jgi:hypothetical protein
MDAYFHSYEVTEAESYRTVIAPTESEETAFPVGRWLLKYPEDHIEEFRDRFPLTVEGYIFG